MKALAWFGTDDVRVIEAGIPDIVDPDDVVLVSHLFTCRSIYCQLNPLNPRIESDRVHHLRLRLAPLPWRDYGSTEGRHPGTRGVYFRVSPCFDLVGNSDAALRFQFMGVVDRVGPNVKNLKIGQRVVSAFQIGCGKCRFCKENLSSFCDNTNHSSSVRYHFHFTT